MRRLENVVSWLNRFIPSWWGMMDIKSINQLKSINTSTNLKITPLLYRVCTLRFSSFKLSASICGSVRKWQKQFELWSWSLVLDLSELALSSVRINHAQKRTSPTGSAYSKCDMATNQGLRYISVGKCGTKSAEQEDNNQAVEKIQFRRLYQHSIML